MIFGNVNNEFLDQQTAILPAPLKSALCFLKETDLAAHEPGRFEIELGGVPMVLQVLDLTTSPRQTAGGPERAGYYNDDKTSVVDEDLLDTPRDILFYKDNQDAPEGTIEMVPGTYAVYFPWDVHIPAIQTGDVPAAIRKIVIKVPMDACLGTGKD